MEFRVSRRKTKRAECWIITDNDLTRSSVPTVDESSLGERVFFPWIVFFFLGWIANLVERAGSVERAFTMTAQSGEEKATYFAGWVIISLESSKRVVEACSSVAAARATSSDLISSFISICPGRWFRIRVSVCRCLTNDSWTILFYLRLIYRVTRIRRTNIV